MPRTVSLLLLSALLGLVWPGPGAIAAPPEAVSGRMVPDEVPQLQAEVRRCERAVARAERGLPPEWGAAARGAAGPRG
jgi:hypothetical protein